MPSSATGVGMPICLLGGVLLILTQKNSQKFGDVLGIMSVDTDFLGYCPGFENSIVRMCRRIQPK